MSSTCHHLFIMRSWTSFIQSSFNIHPRFPLSQCFYVSVSLLNHPFVDTGRRRKGKLKLVIISRFAFFFFFFPTIGRRLVFKSLIKTTHQPGTYVRDRYFVCTNDWGRATRRGAGSAGWQQEMDIHLQTATGGVLYQRPRSPGSVGPQPGWGHGRAVLERDWSKTFPSIRWSGVLTTVSWTLPAVWAAPQRAAASRFDALAAIRLLVENGARVILRSSLGTAEQQTGPAFLRGPAWQPRGTGAGPAPPRALPL